MKDNKIDFSGKKILVIGGTGFIGGRLVEKLVVDCNAYVRVLVRNYGNASRIARFPVEMFNGDVLELEKIENAMNDIDIVFHCAFGSQGSSKERQHVNVIGTRNVMEAALRTGVKRVVYLSTQMVYGVTPEGDVDETAPHKYCNIFGNYSSSKMDAEKIVQKYIEKHRLPVSIIQPTAVYGPFAPGWTVGVIEMIKTGRIILVNGGDGHCNAVYIDDVVNAILLASVKEDALGNAFLISGEKPVTWKAFFNRFEKIFGTSRTVNMSAAEAVVYYKKHRKKKKILREVFQIFRENPSVRGRILQTSEMIFLRKIVSFFMPDSIQQLIRKRFNVNGDNSPQDIVKEEEVPIHPIDPALIKFYEMKTNIRIDKARSILGYEPSFDFESGMKLTEEWARWSNLIDR